jgi:hypothetical protein
MPVDFQPIEPRARRDQRLAGLSPPERGPVPPEAPVPEARGRGRRRKIDLVGALTGGPLDNEALGAIGAAVKLA